MAHELSEGQGLVSQGQGCASPPTPIPQTPMAAEGGMDATHRIERALIELHSVPPCLRCLGNSSEQNRQTHGFYGVSGEDRTHSQQSMLKRENQDKDRNVVREL